MRIPLSFCHVIHYFTVVSLSGSFRLLLCKTLYVFYWGSVSMPPFSVLAKHPEILLDLPLHLLKTQEGPKEQGQVRIWFHGNWSGPLGNQSLSSNGGARHVRGSLRGSEWDELVGP